MDRNDDVALLYCALAFVYAFAHAIIIQTQALRVPVLRLFKVALEHRPLAVGHPEVGGGVLKFHLRTVRVLGGIRKNQRILNPGTRASMEEAHIILIAPRTV